jgi:hypothetical protein
LNIEQTAVLFTPDERSLIAQAVHNEALRLKIVPSTPFSIVDNHPIQSSGLIYCKSGSCNFLFIKDSNIPEQSNKLSELRDQKRRRTKYVTQPNRKSFYDVKSSFIFQYKSNIHHFLDCTANDQHSDGITSVNLHFYSLKNLFI